MRGNNNSWINEFLKRLGMTSAITFYRRSIKNISFNSVLKDASSVESAMPLGINKYDTVDQIDLVELKTHSY